MRAGKAIGQRDECGGCAGVTNTWDWWRKCTRFAHILLITLVIVLSLSKLSGQEIQCKLDTIFTIEFIKNWADDSSGTLGIRMQPTEWIYMGSLTYQPLNEKNEYFPLLGISKECIKHYFGNPNTIDSSGSYLKWTYFIEGEVLSGTLYNEYIGFSLLITLNKDYEVIDFNIIIPSRPIISINGISGKDIQLSNEIIRELDTIQVHFKDYKVVNYSLSITVFTSHSTFKRKGNVILAEDKKHLHRVTACYQLYVHDVVIRNAPGNEIELDDFIFITPFENCNK